MKYSQIFLEKINCKSELEVFRFLINNLVDTISTWEYFVKWAKVLGNLENVELNLNILNYVLGKDDVKNELAKVLRQHPQVISVFPILIACRDCNFKILKPGTLEYDEFNFGQAKNLDEAQIEKSITFLEKIGLLELFQKRRIKNLVDYVLGIEIGLDSNGRKNRSGDAMEAITGEIIEAICTKHGFSFMVEATAPKIRECWGIHVSVDKSTRRFDFAVLNNNSKLYLIETNYYSGTGSKLKATAGEYKALYDFVTLDGHGFIWITDGMGWLTTQRPLEEAFIHIDYIFNLRMLNAGLLEYIILNNL